MKTFQVSIIRPLTWFGLFLMAFGGTVNAAAADSKLEIQLVWGTNDDSSSDPKHKPLEVSLAKKLGMFKWKKYFTVNQREVSLVPQTAQKIKLSARCEIEIKQLEGQRYQINVYGEGKHLKKITEKITKQDALTIAGDDKNDCGWFILIREI